MDLAAYVRDLLRKGYQAEQVRQYLLRYGYTRQDVDRAFYNASHVKHRGKGTFLIGVVIALVVIGAVAGYFLWPRSAGTAGGIDLSVGAVQGAEAGASVRVPVTVSGRGPVSLKAEVFAPSGERIAFESITAAQDHATITIPIPSSASTGTYDVTVTARAGASVATRSTSVTISSSAPTASCSDGIQNQGESGVDCGGPCQACSSEPRCPASCNDGDPATRDSCGASTGYQCAHERVVRCGDGLCAATESAASCPSDCQETTTASPWDELDAIAVQGQHDPQGAAVRCGTLPNTFRDRCLDAVGEAGIDPTVCDRIVDEYYRDKCFTEVARGLGRSTMCENVAKESRRDNCYINFALDGEYTVCELIVNTYLQRSCTTLKATGS